MNSYRRFVQMSKRHHVYFIDLFVWFVSPRNMLTPIRDNETSNGIHFEDTGFTSLPNSIKLFRYRQSSKENKYIWFLASTLRQDQTIVSQQPVKLYGTLCKLKNVCGNFKVCECSGLIQLKPSCIRTSWSVQPVIGLLQVPGRTCMHLG